MPRTTAGLRPDDRLSTAAIDPAWQKWIDLVELAVEESRQPAWSECVRFNESRPAEAPLLHGATIRLPSRASEFAIRVAASLGIVSLEAIRPVEMVRIGLERDSRDLESAASALAVSTDTVAVLGQLCAHTAAAQRRAESQPGSITIVAEGLLPRVRRLAQHGRDAWHPAGAADCAADAAEATGCFRCCTAHSAAKSITRNSGRSSARATSSMFAWRHARPAAVTSRPFSPSPPCLSPRSQ